MKKNIFFACLMGCSIAAWSQTVVFELEIGTPGKGLDAFIINDAEAVEIDVIKPPAGFGPAGLELGSGTNSIWLDNFRGTDYQLDVIWLDVGQYDDDTSGNDADGILTIRARSEEHTSELQSH